MSSFIPSQSLKIISGKTNNSGVFNFNVAIDTTLFNDYHLCIRITRPKDYISSFYDDDGHKDFIGINFWDYNAEALQNIDIVFYKKTVLTINFNRTATDDCEYLSVFHSFDEHNISYLFKVSELVQNEALRIQQFETAADIYTKITWEKIRSNRERDTYIDSLICRQNRDNIFNINY